MTTETTETEAALELQVMAAESNTLLIKLDQVDDNPWQPRGELTEIPELAEDIRQNGLLQRPQVRPMPDGRYQCVLGHRRLAALRHLGVTEYMLEVRKATDSQMAIRALAENSRRVNLKPLEEYRAWQKCLEIDGMTVQALSQVINLDRSTVSNNLRLLRLPPFVLERVDAGEMSAHAGREFLCLMGSDGHFHETEAKEALQVLTTGSPDWRVGRVRHVIQKAVAQHPVAEWRRLFSEGQYDTSGPAFDVEAFNQEHGAKVHTLPKDEWTSWDPTNAGSKLKKEGSGDWTCATGPWVKAQKAGKAAAEGVAGAAAKKTTPSEPKTPGKTSKWPQTLSQDPVFKNVSPETDGPLMKTLTKDERNEAAAAQMGTRGTPGTVPAKGSKGFAGPVDERHEGGWAWQAYEVRKRPGYFADIIECRTKCTTGAQYLQQNDKAPLELFCTNESCWDQHCSKGRKVLEAKVAKEIRDLDARDAELYAVLEATTAPQPGPVAQLMAAMVLRDIKLLKVDPGTRDWEVDRELAAYPANPVALAAAAGAESPVSLVDGRAFDVNDGNARELLLRGLVERSRDKNLQPFVDQLVNATVEPALPAEPENLAAVVPLHAFELDVEFAGVRCKQCGTSPDADCHHGADVRPATPDDGLSQE